MNRRQKQIELLRLWYAQQGTMTGARRFLAEKMGVTPDAVNHWLLGRRLPRYPMYLKLERFLKREARKDRELAA